MNSSENNHDDLTEIKGIGPARQKWFNKSLGVFNFQDLAELSADVIESQLKADNQIASRKTIETWIAEAQKRVALANLAAQKTTSNTTEAEQFVNDAGKEKTSPPQAVRLKDNDDDGEGSPPTIKDGWKPFASFVIEFQERPGDNQAVEYRTSVHHMEADNSKEWPGIERDKHCHWMLDQLGDRISKEPAIEEPPAQEVILETVPVARSPMRVEIGQVRAYQPPNADTPALIGQAGQSLEGHLKGKQPFALEIRFELVGEAALELTSQQVSYHMRSYVQDEITGETTQLADPEPSMLIKGELSYAVKFPEVALAPGKYLLFAVVNVQAASVTPDFITFPKVNIIR